MGLRSVGEGWNVYSIRYNADGYIVQQSDPVVHGGAGDDILYGDYFQNTTFISGRGSDTIVALREEDTCVSVYEGNSSDYSVKKNTDGTVLVTSLNGWSVDTLTKIDILRFDDVDVNLTAANNAPVAQADILLGTEDASLVISASTILYNDRDVDGDVISLTGITSATHGTAVAQGENILFTPDANFNGVASFGYTISDGRGGQSSQTVTINIGSVNDLPVAPEKSYSIQEDGTLVIQQADGLLAGATDVDGDVLAVIGPVVSANGANIFVNANGSFSYQPKTNFNGIDTFTYTVSDGNGGLVERQAEVLVSSVNDAPTATLDNLTTSEGVALNIQSATLLANDSDIDGDALTLQSVSNVSNGTVSLDGGIVTFTPDDKFNGAASFDYTILDASGSLASQHVVVSVLPSQHAPIALADVFSTLEDTALTVVAANGLLRNDTDPNGKLLHVVAQNIVSDNGASVSIGEDGSFTYSAAANYHGVDSFAYTVISTDGYRTGSTASVDVQSVNDTPLAAADGFTVSANAQLEVTDAFGLLSNDQDPDGDQLQLASYDEISVNGGFVQAQENGGFTYRPKSGFSGQDSFTYSVTDGNGGSASATVSVVVTQENQSIVAVADGYGLNEDSILSVAVDGGVLQNDTSSSGATLKVSRYDHTSEAGGSVIMRDDGSFSYIPVADFFGIDRFDYTVTDGRGESITSSVTLTINPVDERDDASNQVLKLVDDFKVVAEDAYLVVSSNQGVIGPVRFDADGNQLEVSAYDHLSANGGEVSVNADGSFSYIPVANFHGRDSFNYTVTNGDESASATVYVDVTSVNDLPVAQDDSASGAEDTVLFVNAQDILANDSDVDGDTLKIASIVSATHGLAVLTEQGDIKFTPDANFNGLAAVLCKIDDGNGGVALQSVQISIAAENDSPVTGADGLSMDEDAVLTIQAQQLLVNDFDIEGDVISLTDVTNAKNGSVILDGNKTIHFTPDQNFFGLASFDYIVADGFGGYSTQTVSISVQNVQDSPDATSDFISALEDVKLFIAASDLTSNDVDLDRDQLELISVGNAVGGTVAMSTLTGIEFAPLANYNGLASFDYQISDGHGGFDTGSVTISIQPVNDNPHAIQDNLATMEDVSVTISASTLLSSDTDIDGDVLHIDWVGNAAHGVASFDASGNVLFTPTLNYSGAATFSYRVSDGNGGYQIGNVAIEVAAVNDAPVAAQDTLSVTEDELCTFSAATLLANDYDADAGDQLTLLTIDSSTTFGSITQNDDGSYTYFAGAAYNSLGRNQTSVDHLTYIVTDLDGSSASTTVDIIVSGRNDAPVVSHPLLFSGSENAGTIELNLLDGAFDVDIGDSLAILNLRQTSGQSTTFSTSNGAIRIDSSQFAYLQAGESEQLTFEYSVTDGIAETPQIMTLSILGTNDAPVATNVSLGAIGSYETMDITPSMLLSSVSDAEGDALALIGVGNAVGCHVNIATSGNIHVTPLLGCTGDISFEYVVADSMGGTASATAYLQSVQPAGVIIGNSANNTITVSVGGSVTNGMGGADTIKGSAEADTIVGGAGNDYLLGNDGDDLFLYQNGDGVDRVNGGSGYDKLVATAGDDVIAFSSFAGVDTVEEIDGGAGVNVIQGTTANNNLDFTGTKLVNIASIAGSDGADTIKGSAEADTIVGGAGNDTLYGNAGADTFMFDHGSGKDRIVNLGRGGDGDVVQFGVDILTDQLWFARSGNDLLVSVIGTSDQVNIQGWYANAANHVDSFKTSDGKELLDSQVNNLVNAMAAFTPPAAGQTTLPQNYQDQLTPVIAANWHVG